MSGDVQPRKRKDKKKRKDGDDEPQHHSPRSSVSIADNDDVNIHVHKDSSTGGGLCAKFVFFILLTALAVLIGLIVTEHRGLTHLDTIEKENRFSQLFEGWVDTTPDDHDDHHVEHLSEELEQHDESDHAEDDHDVSEHEEDDHDEEDDHAEEDEHEDEDVSEQAQSVEVDEDDDKVNDLTEEDDDKVNDLTEEDEDDKVNDVTEEDEDNDDDDEDTGEQDDEVENASDANNEDDVDDDVSEPKSEEPASVERGDSEEMQRDEIQKEPEENEEDEIQDVDEETVVKIEEPSEEVPDNDDQSIGVAKASVGVIILVVAYIVLVKKWKSGRGNEQEETVLKVDVQDLSRRNTIVMPPKIEEVVQQVIEQNVEEFSEDEQLSEEEIKLFPKVTAEYKTLKSTYERSLTPDSEPDIQRYEYDAEEHADEEEEDEEIEGEYEYEDEELAGEEEELEEEEEIEEEEEEIEEEFDDEEEPISEIDDEELMKKFEAKYGKLSGTKQQYEVDDEEEEEPEVEGDEDYAPTENVKWKRNQASGEQVVDYINEWEVEPNSYNYEENNENREDDLEDQLTEAENVMNINAALALNTFNQILTKYPKSVRGLYGKAQCLDRLADQKRSNSLLIEAIQAYWEVLELKTVPENVFVAAGERSINRMRFIGQYGRAVDVHKLFIEKYPRNVTYRNQLAVTYLTVNKIKESRDLLEETLKQWPDNGFALVHYGFILKVNDNNLVDSIEYLRRGIRTKEPGVVDGRFYFHLGDALARSHRAEEAERVYEEGVRMGVFLSKYQRSLYNVNKLTARPWWTKEQLKVYQQFLNHLEDHHRAIRNEGLAVLNAKGHFQDEAENLRDSGDWKQFELYARGQKNKANCEKCPFTCKLMESLSDAVGCRRGQIKFSVMHPGTHVWPHCGPTNCRLRIHLGLKVPANTYIRVADETKTWREGKVLIFDDSFEHEVWHNGSDFRLVLIIDVWHPELSPMEKRSLSAI